LATATGARVVTIDPCHTCQPLGAAYLVLGIRGAVPLVHGSQGCCSYVRYLFNRHFREPVKVAATSFHEDAAVFGGRRNLVEGIKNLLLRYSPRFIGVVSTCLSETIGDNIDSIIREVQKELNGEINVSSKQVKIVPIHTPSYAGSHIKGYDNASRAVLEYLVQPGKDSNGKLNVIPGIINPGDIEEIKHILVEMDVPFLVLYDISRTLDTPLEISMSRLPKEGTSIKELADAANSLGTIALCRHAGGAGARYLQKKFNIPALLGPLPVGIVNTDRFLDNVKKLTGKEIPSSLEWERGILLDAMADSCQYTMMKRAALMGDPDIVAGTTRFICELGMEPAVVMSSTASDEFVREVEVIAREYDYNPVVISGGDLYDFESALKKRRADIILSPSHGVEIARKVKVPVVRLGFPVYDRVGYHRRAIVGYRGSLRLLDLIVNSLLEFS